MQVVGCPWIDALATQLLGAGQWAPVRHSTSTPTHSFRGGRTFTGCATFSLSISIVPPTHHYVTDSCPAKHVASQVWECGPSLELSCAGGSGSRRRRERQRRFGRLGRGRWHRADAPVRGGGAARAARNPEPDCSLGWSA